MYTKVSKHLPSIYDRMIYVLASILSYDIWFYISHLILHTRSVYKYHKEHHQYVNPHFLDAYKGHIVESVFQGVGIFFPLIVLPYNVTELCIALLFVNIRGMMRHDERCVYLIGNHHLLHHLHPSYNFGEYWIDYLFGTMYVKEDEHVAGILYH